MIGTRRMRKRNSSVSMRETAKAAAAFEAYCAMGPERSLAKLAENNQRYAKSIPLLKKWSAQHQWVERAKQFDHEQAEIARKLALKEGERKRKKREEELEKMNERHAQLAINAQYEMLKRINFLIEQDKFSAYSSVTLLKLATDLERVARGAATEIANMQVSGDEERPLVIKTIWDRALLELPAEPKQDKEEGQNDGRTEAE